MYTNPYSAIYCNIVITGGGGVEEGKGGVEEGKEVSEEKERRIVIRRSWRKKL